MENYRDIYKKFYGSIPDGYEIHHIDHDRNNNEIFNLIALSKELHQEYHVLKQKVSKLDKGVYRHLDKGVDSITGVLSFELTMLRDYISFLEIRLKILNMRDECYYSKLMRG